MLRRSTLQPVRPAVVVSKVVALAVLVVLPAVEHSAAALEPAADSRIDLCNRDYSNGDVNTSPFFIGLP